MHKVKIGTIKGKMIDMFAHHSQKLGNQTIKKRGDLSYKINLTEMIY